MAMKPAGKAIVAAVVVLGAIAGAHFGGVFDKLKKQGETVQAVQPKAVQPSETIAPVERPLVAQPEPAAPAAPAPTSIPQPINSPIRQSDAFDQLIRQSGTK